MKNKILILLIITLFASACGITDPTTVENPNVIEEDFLSSPNAMVNWSRGVERQFAITVDGIILGAMLVSDSYMNNRTLYSKVFDLPEMPSSDLDVRLIQSEIATLREEADFGINKVATADESTSSDQLAEMYFYRGMAFLFSGEYFTGLPAESEGVPQSPTSLLNSAVNDFKTAINTTNNNEKKGIYNLAAARAYYRLGDKANARNYAEASLSFGTNLLRTVIFDTETPNGVQVAIYSGQDEFQPLPRLDFLDPKFHNNDGTTQKEIPVIKSEEAYLILSEINISDGDISGAKNQLKDLVVLVNSRPTEFVDESSEERGAGRSVEYPNSDTILVRASANDEYRAGLIRTRGVGATAVEVPMVSGTSVDETYIDNLTTSNEVLHTIYLMRQEIFMAEGRRMVDLGIKWPLADLEAQSNPNASGSSYLTPQIPQYIPLNKEMDAFTWDKVNGTVTILFDMNDVIVNNKASNFIVPFE